MVVVVVVVVAGGACFRTGLTELQQVGGERVVSTHGAYRYVRYVHMLQQKRGERTKTNPPSPLLAVALRTPHLTPNAKGDQRLPRG